MIKFRHQQAGAAALIVTIIILVLMLIVVGFVSKLSLLELKSNINIDRSREASIIAQGALDYGAKRFEKDNSDTFHSDVLGGFYTVSAAVSTDFVTITASASSADNSARQTVEQKFGYVPLVGFGELPPVMANGTFDPSGNLTVVANPNGGGEGVPVSVWAESADTSGSFSSCQLDEYNSGDCTSKAMCTSGMAASECIDFVVPSSGVIPDVFENLFGIKGEYWESVREASKRYDVDGTSVKCDSALFSQISSDISSFYNSDNALKDDNTLPVVWIEYPASVVTSPANPVQTCNIDSLGSANNPVILVVHGGLSLSNTATIYGVVMSFADTYVAPGDPVESVRLVTNGGATVYGSLLANTDVNIGNGGGTVIFDEAVMDRLSNNGEGSKLLGRRAGSWTDLE